jgi:RimJ/RimL family protein N-acetyltransferase
MLRAPRISIGPFIPDDFGATFCWVNDVAAARLDFAYRPVDLMTHRQWFDGFAKDPTKVVFAIRKNTEPAIIGFVQITSINLVHRSAELGIRIGEEKNRSQGYGSEALRLAVAFAFNHLNLNRVQLVVFRHNQRAIGAYRTAGFKKEGVLRKAAFIDGAWVDLMLMAALRPTVVRRRSVQPAATLPVARGDRHAVGASAAC